jgi:hypothetical protein
MFRLLPIRNPAAVGRLVAVVAVLLALPAAAQDGPKYDTWTKAEASAEAREYLEQIKGGQFDEKAKAFLERIALPQLGMDGNRKTIERVRKRIRDFALNERTAGGDAIEAANKAAAAWLQGLARKADADPVVRVNAMLLVGELRAKDGRPWPAAVSVLAAAVADTSLAPAIRVAAASGLARHVDTARASSSVDPVLVQEAGKRLVAVIAAPPAGDRVASEWIVSRALDMLPVVAPKASPEAAAALIKILDDTARPTDVRVRAAAALGATAVAESRVDATRVLAAVRGLAITALKSDRDAAAERALARQVGGPAAAAAGPTFSMEFSGAGAMVPGVQAAATATLPIDPLVVRRDAWRLAALATAVKPAEGDRGIASLLAGPAKAAAEELATSLRSAAQTLDASPDADAVKAALESLERLPQPVAAPAAPTTPKPGPAAPATKPTPGAKPAPAAPEPAAAPVPNDPFGPPGNN